MAKKVVIVFQKKTERRSNKRGGRGEIFLGLKPAQKKAVIAVPTRDHVTRVFKDAAGAIPGYPECPFPPSSCLKFTAPDRSIMIPTGPVTVHVGDCIEGMRDMPSSSIDLIVADMPYNINKPIVGDDHDDATYLDLARQWIAGGARVLKETGSMYVMCSVRYAPYIFQILKDGNGLQHVNTIVWPYTGRTHAVKNELAHEHEQILFFCKDKDKKTFHMDDLRDPYGFVRFDRKNNRKGKALSDVWDDITSLRWNNDERHAFYKKDARGTITEKGHPTQKPVKLMARMILLSSNPGDVVLDPFLGSGTTAVACVATGRKCIGFEIDPRWKGIIETRVEAAAQSMKNTRVDAFTGTRATIDSFFEKEADRP